MMFATCSQASAQKFFKSGMPSKIVTKETCPKLFKALLGDIVRVTDPAFHAFGLICGNNYADDKAVFDDVYEEIENAPSHPEGHSDE